MARACVHLLEPYDGPERTNIGVGEDLTIRELAELVAEIVGFEGELNFDTTKPDGTPRKLLDVSKIHTLGWKARIDLRDGLTRTYRWYREQLDSGALQRT